MKVKKFNELNENRNTNELYFSENYVYCIDDRDYVNIFVNNEDDLIELVKMYLSDTGRGEYEYISFYGVFNDIKARYSETQDFILLDSDSIRINKFLSLSQYKIDKNTQKYGI